MSPRDARVLTIVQAGGQGSRLDVLTRERAKPALPYAGTHQLIDFTLSAVMHAGLPDVWVAVQYLASSLDPHLSQGRPWDLDRTRGGYRRVVPEEGGAGPSHEGFASGNADHLHRIWPQVLDHDPAVVVTMSADHVFNVDLREVVDAHLESGAECTVVTSEVGLAEARHKAVVTLGRGGRVTGFEDKPERPTSGTVATEIFVHDARVLGEVLEEVRRRVSPTPATEDDAEEDTGLEDFGHHLLPALVRRGRVRAFALPGYWKDLGRPSAYLQAHRDLVRGRVDVFGHADRPIVTRAAQEPAARVRDGAVVRDALLSPGCDVRGEVSGSVLGPGSWSRRARSSATASSSPTSSSAPGPRSRRRSSTTASSSDGGPSSRAAAGRRLTDDAVTLLGRDSVVRGGDSLAAGARLEPGTRT